MEKGVYKMTGRDIFRGGISVEKGGMRKSVFLFLLPFLFPLFFSTLAVHAAAPPALQDLIGEKEEVFDKLKAEEFLLPKDPLRALFRWTSDKRTEARYPVYRDYITLKYYEFDPAEVKFLFREDGALESIFISIYNRGDMGEVSEEQFQKMVDDLDARITDFAGDGGREQKAKLTAKVVNRQKVWIRDGRIAYIMRWSSTGRGRSFQSEYIQLVIERFDPNRDPRRESLVSTDRRDVKKGKALTDNIVKEEDGTVFIDNIPMVDQGEKGYCAVAVGERMMRYFGNENVNQHVLAQLAGSTEDGTRRDFMVAALKRIGVKFGVRARERYVWNESVKDVERTVGRYNSKARKMKKDKISMVVRNRMVYWNETLEQMDLDVLRAMRLGEKSDYRKFQTTLREYVNKGIPVIWCVTLGIVPEENLSQARGGHMRLLTGYNEKTSTVVYSDSWGAGHEKKTMPMDDAWVITDAVLTLEPRK